MKAIGQLVMTVIHFFTCDYIGYNLVCYMALLNE